VRNKGNCPSARKWARARSKTLTRPTAQNKPNFRDRATGTRGNCAKQTQFCRADRPEPRADHAKQSQFLDCGLRIGDEPTAVRAKQSQFRPGWAGGAARGTACTNKANFSRQGRRGGSCAEQTQFGGRIVRNKPNFGAMPPETEADCAKQTQFGWRGRRVRSRASENAQNEPRLRRWWKKSGEDAQPTKSRRGRMCETKPIGQGNTHCSSIPPFQSDGCRAKQSQFPGVSNPGAAVSTL